MKKVLLRRVCQDRRCLRLDGPEVCVDIMQLARLRLDPTVAPLQLHSLNGWVAVRCRPNIVQVFERRTLRQVCRRRSAYVQDVAPRAFGAVDPLTLDHYAGIALEAARAKCQLDW